jgi:voltage-gated potassium channel Kch
LLRPVGDYYSFGSSATKGFLRSVVEWWGGWSGDISLVVVWVLLVGLPLVWLPFGASSSIAFLVTGIVVGGVAVVALSLSKRLPWWRTALVWSTVTFGWWTFLWARGFVFPDGNNRVLAEYLTHWQTVNVSYVIVPALHLVVFFALIDGRPFGKRFTSFFVVFLGLLLGMSGLVWGASLGAFALLLVFGKWILTGIRSGVPFLYYFLGAAIGILISLNSPGANARRQYLPELEFPEAIFSAIRAAPKGVGNWFETVFSVQTLLVLGIGMVTAWFADSQLQRTPLGERPLRLVFFLVPLSLLLATVSSISQSAVYEAPYHILSTQLLVFLWSILLGHYFYLRLKILLSRASGFDLQIWVGKTTILMTILGLLTAGTVGVTSSIVDRRDAWEAGNAPVGDWYDREDEDWIKSAWETLQNYRSSRAQN